MASDNELIVVGMKHQPYFSKSKLTVGDTVYLRKETTNQVNPAAVSVHIVKDNGEAFNEHNRIGYIRDVDLSKAKKYFGGFLICSGSFKVTRICANYLILQEHTYLKEREREHYRASNALFGEPAPKQKEYNPCNEIELPDYNQPKEDKQMINTNTMMNNFFKKCDNIAMDMQTGKLGVKTPNGIVVATDDGVAVNPITEMGFTIPAFAMRVPVAELVKGDILISAGEPTFFREGSKVGYLTTTLSGVFQETGIVTNLFFGKNTVMAVKNMFGNDGSEGGMNPMMMMAFMGDSDSDGSGFDMKKMMMMQMLMGQGGSGNQMNPMMMMAMSSMFK